MNTVAPFGLAVPIEMPGQRMDGDTLHCGRVERCKGVANRIQVMRLKENGMKVDQWSEINVRFYHDIEFIELFTHANSETRTFIRRIVLRTRAVMYSYTQMLQSIRTFREK
jgi:hypothetical protein